MNRLSKTQNIIYCLGGLLLLVGAILPTFPELRFVAPFVYTSGAVMFAAMQMLARYDGANLVLRRLRRQQLIGAILLIVAGGLMFMSVLQLRPFRGDEWKLVLAIAAVLQLYTSFRIPSEMQKEEA